MIKILIPENQKDWNSWIIRFPNYSFFHTAEWSKVLDETYNYKPIYFSSFQNQDLTTLIPTMEIKSKLTGNRLVSLPFSDYCDPLFYSIEDLELLKDFVFDYCSNNKSQFIEFRSSDIKFPFETQNFKTDLRHILYIDSDESQLQKHLSDNTKRNIKSALKEGLIVKEDNSIEAINTFYELQCLTRKRHGLPPQPKIFFNNIFKNIIAKNRGNILFSFLNDKPVAALMFFTFGEKVLYKFGASVSKNLPKGANHLLIWEAIKKYSDEGYKEFDFGRTETNHDGLRRFKLGFGAEERIIYTSRFNVKKNSFLPVNSQSKGSYNQIFKKLPLPILKLIGKTIYKHVG